MDEADWMELILDAVEDSRYAQLADERRTYDNNMFSNIEVTYPDNLNTLETLSRVPENAQNETRVIVRTDRNTIQFKQATYNTSVENPQITSLIRQILSEDIPVRRGFKPEYTISDSCIIVKSPELQPVSLFKNMFTRFWVLTGVYEQDGLYHHRFEQRKPVGDGLDEDPLERYGEYRLLHISHSISISCSNCAGEVSYSPLSQEDGWGWKCNSCEQIYEQSKTDFLDNIHPLWSRQKIERQMREQAHQHVCNT